MTYRVLIQHRRLLIVLTNVMLVVIANYFALLLRFEGVIPPDEMEIWLSVLPWLVLVRSALFLPFRLYEGLWRYTGMWDLRNIVVAVASGSVANYVLVHWLLGLTRYPRSVFVLDALVLVFLMGGIRVAPRVYRELGHIDREKRVLIYGAGDAGEMIVRDMRNNPFYEYEPIGFIDDDRKKAGHRIHGVPVFGGRDRLPTVISKHSPDEVLIAMPSADAVTMRTIVQVLEPYKVPIKTLPSLRDVLRGSVSVKQIRNLAIEDLLSRTAVDLGTAPLSSFLAGKRVMVTGAGGSIGSELSRQIAVFGPAELVLLDRYENGLFSVVNDLEAGGVGVRPVVCNVGDKDRIERVFRDYRPEIVFHAAAHKHVPLMELNPAEAVRNNVFGTRTLAEIAARCGVERFVFVSSDKAVHPSSVMGATKRICELMMQALGSTQSGCFVAVRFGNVLASSGSVIPLFLRQIDRGGPVTVTHPDMRRYFMLIPEAVQLMLHVAAVGKSGSIYVLEMGEQIKVLDIARTLIRVSGFVPEKEIAIKFVGLRPGEKLCEELVGQDESVEPSGIEKVLRVQGRDGIHPEELNERLDSLWEVTLSEDVSGIVKKIGEIVPTYQVARPRAFQLVSGTHPPTPPESPRPGDTT